MAINLMCMNDKCKYYFEDNCMRNINEERLNFDENGKCVTFEKGDYDNEFIKNMNLKVEKMIREHINNQHVTQTINYNSCENCSNKPINGEFKNCNCTLVTPKIT